MTRVSVTGSTNGPALDAALAVLVDGHEVVLHLTDLPTELMSVPLP